MIFLGFLWAFLFNIAAACEFFPQENDNGKVEIEIIGNPVHFVPSSVYPVEIRSKHAFRELLVTSEGNGTGGIFQVINDGKTTFSESCLNTITQSTKKLKKRISTHWAAPPEGCANLRAALKIEGVWETTSKTICSIDVTPSTVKECCACDHAKYRLTFEGIWSSTTHPKDYPTILWMTHFSDIIGATHSADFSMWEEGKLSTYGVQQMAEYGIVRELENELRNQSKKLRSIVHAAGLWYPDVNSITTAVFKVDPRKHLLSITSMFGPSPDWFVGLSKYDLCLPNCTWLENVQMDLYPYDAGTDSGISYMSPNVPTDPPERIQKITTMFPEDARSPFYDPINNKMESFAKLTIKRETLYPKKCTDLTEEEILQEVSESENTEDENREECQVSSYSDWSSCSVSCGKGIRQRSRTYLNADKAQMSKCDRQLISKEMCAAPLAKCPGDEEEDDIAPLNVDSACEVTAWTDWSGCTATCGIGMTFRSRSLVSNANSSRKRCMHISLMEKQKCMEPPCHSQQEKVPRSCSVSEWSEWSPCSTSCGEGQRKRIRHFLGDNVPKFCHSGVKLYEILKCTNPSKCEVESSEAESVCLLDITEGPCRGPFRKWGFDKITQTCIEFIYGGCRGNRNNFPTFESCNQTCGGVKVESIDGDTNEKVDCEVGKWSTWSPCYPCTNGSKTKTRKVLRAPKNGGKPCPLLQKTVQCSVPMEFCQA